MSHTRWDELRPLLNRAALEVQMAYVDGYILALEDLLRDIKELRPPEWVKGTDGQY